MPSAYPGAFAAPKRRWTGFTALLAGVLTALMVVGGLTAAPAMAADGTVERELPAGTGSPNGQPVFVEGESYTLTIKYSNSVVPGGHTAVISVPKGFTITEAPEANSAVESFELADGQLTIKFKDPIKVSNGSMDLNFTVNTLTSSSEETVDWAVNGTPTSQQIIFKKQGDDFRNIDDGGQKDGRDLSFPAPVIDGNGMVVLDPETFLAKEVTYVITASSKNAREVVIADTLATGMTLVPGSFTMSKTWWDEKGMNMQSDGVDMSSSQYEGGAFSHTFSAEQNSIYVMEYRAKIADAAALKTLRDALQASYDAVKDKEKAGYSIQLKNTATIAGQAGSKSFSIGGTTPEAPKPGLGKAFTKKSDLPAHQPITLKEDGETLDPALPVTYTLGTDLTQFAAFAGNPKHELKRNVVITDELPGNLEWAMTKSDFANLGLGLSTATSAEEFASNAHVGTYMLDGQTLRINVGKDTTKNYAFPLKAQLLNIKGATATANPEDSPYLSTLFSGLGNWAMFEYSAGDPHWSSVEHKVGIAKDPTTGINDKNKFRKLANSEPIVLDEGETVAQIPFTFEVGKGVGDAAKSTIVDHVDHDLLDVTEETLAAIKQSITGKYNDRFDLDGTSFDVSLNDANDLVFTPNASFPLKGESAAKPLTEKFWFTATLPTKPITGKEAITVENRASMTGEDHNTVFVSKTESSAGVGGREIDVKKTVFNPDKGDFTTNLRAKLNEDGTLVTDEYVYRVQFIPTLGYTKMLFDITDELAKNLEFVGFVNPDQFESGETAGKGEYRIPGTELTAKFSEDDNRITVGKNQPITGGAVTELFFKVKIKTFVEGEGVENVIGSEKVTITPTNKMPLDISKLDETNPTGTPITDRDARFELRNAAGDVVLSDLYIVGGKLRMAGATGGDAVPTVGQHGTYTIHEIKAPAGFVRAQEPVVLTVDEDGTSQETKFFNTPRSSVKKVSVGDYVWLDVDRDGVQGTSANEKPIAGVKLALTGPDGQPVLDIDGNLVEPIATDGDGFYEFIDLPALKQGETYTVSILQDDEGTQKALEGLIPTKEQGSEDREKDSSSWTSVSRGDLVNDGDKDYSLDFGFHTKSVSVGDYVWLDIDGDGVQGTSPDETPLTGVKLVLTGPDGKQVTDVFGDPVEPTFTNDEGFYEFTDLPALKEGETYTVSIDREDEGTQKALKDLVPTKVEGTDDRELDSSEWTAESRDDLVNDGDRDPSLDFGFRPKAVSVGDYVWLDIDGDGVQGTSPEEKPLSGVKLVLTGPDGKPVTDVFGKPVEPKVTNDEGFYEFTDLPALKEGETYTVSIDREDEGTQKALEGLIPTKVEGTDDRELDSSEWTAESRDDLVNDGDRDPSLDFGFKYKTYAIGDLVWIDANKDGLQDDSEQVLEGVIVRLFDEQGTLLRETTTDVNGLYVFDELRAGTYRVQFELTPAQAKLYSFTKTGGGNTGLDSNAGKQGFSTWIVLDDSNEELTLDYKYADLVGGIKATQGIDPTWDAGVIVNVVPTVPNGSSTIGDLPATGGSLGWGYAAGAASLLLLGAGAMLFARRRSGARA